MTWLRYEDTSENKILLSGVTQQQLPQEYH